MVHWSVMRPSALVYSDSVMSLSESVATYCDHIMDHPYCGTDTDIMLRINFVFASQIISITLIPSNPLVIKLTLASEHDCRVWVD